MRQIITFNNKNWELPEPILYTEYKYLHFTSNSSASGSVFNSGYYANANTKIVLKCIFIPSNNGNSGQGILGTRASASDPNAWFLAWMKYIGSLTSGRYYGNTGNGSQYDGNVAHNRLTNEITITMTMSTATITDGTTTYTINFGTTSRGTTTDPIILGGFWNEEHKYLTMLGYWGECKIYENDVLLHNFVPATKKSDNTVGLWDKSTNAFITPIDTNYIPTPVNSAS